MGVRLIIGDPCPWRSINDLPEDESIWILWVNYESVMIMPAEWNSAKGCWVMAKPDIEWDSTLYKFVVAWMPINELPPVVRTLAIMGPVFAKVKAKDTDEVQLLDALLNQWKLHKDSHQKLADSPAVAKLSVLALDPAMDKVPIQIQEMVEAALMNGVDKAVSASQVFQDMIPVGSMGPEMVVPKSMLTMKAQFTPSFKPPDWCWAKTGPCNMQAKEGGVDVCVDCGYAQVTIKSGDLHGLPVTFGKA